MKHIALTLLLFISAAATACGIHQFKVPLNQRGFYNPAALCPYCEGSSFVATGAFAGIRSNDFGMFVSLGNDGQNRSHGAWDLTWSSASGDNIGVSAYSGRYAWRQPIGTWVLAAGVRASWVKYSVTIVAPDEIIARGERNCFSFDAGMMITNQRGFYAGVSVTNLHQPTVLMNLRPAAEGTYVIKTERGYTATAGGLVNINRLFDVMLDGAVSYSGNTACARPSVMLRLHRKFAFGAAVTAIEREQPVLEVQGGYTSTPFKWLTGIAFTSDGPVIETGIVARFAVQRWKVRPLDRPCVALPVPEAPRTEFTQ
jgi:hypothetical protein